jgi:hypothetical protein
MVETVIYTAGSGLAQCRPLYIENTRTIACQKYPRTPNLPEVLEYGANVYNLIIIENLFVHFFQ